jgi:sentrin-specific protease 1
MGNFLVRNYEKAKLSALGKCRLVSKKETVVIDLDGGESSGRRSDDSGVVEVFDVRDSDAKVDELDDMIVENDVQRRSMSSPDSALTKAIVNLEEHDFSSVHVYKKLLEGVQRRTDTIQSLNFEIELNEKRRDTFQLLRPKKEIVEVKFLLLLFELIHFFSLFGFSCSCFVVLLSSSCNSSVVVVVVMCYFVSLC